MKKTLFFFLFCGMGFCVGYIAGGPFSHKAATSVSITRGNPENVENFGHKAIPLTPQRDKPEAQEPAKVSQQPRPAPPTTPASEIGKLSLPEVHARLQAMDGMLVTAATEEMEQLLVNRWSNLDPIGASQFAADAVAQGGNPRLLQTASAAWAKTDPAGAAQWAATLDSPLARDTAIGQIFNTWASTDPVLASGAIDALPLGSAQTVATSAVARNFIKGNPDAAMKWAERLSGPLQIAATREIVNLLSVTDPAATGAWILKQPSPQTRSEALRQLAGNWAARDPGSAFDYAQSISDPHLQNSFIQSAMQRFSSMDPLAAANWLSSEAARPHADALVGGVSSRWAAFDPGAASTWAAAFANPELRNKAVSAVSTSWAQSNPAAAAQWIGSIGEAQTRDTAIAAFSVQMAKANPASGAQWAAQISDPAKLRSSMNRIVGDWKKIDPTAARLFVQSSNVLPADLKQRLLR